MSNRRRHDLEIKPDQLGDINPEFASAVNERLKRISEALEASSGLRGTVRIAKQKKFSNIAGRETISDLGIHLEDNRAGMAADPIDPQDLVNLRSLQKMIDEHDPDSTDDVTDLIDDEDDGTPSAATTSIDHFFGICQPASNDSFTPNAAGLNALFVHEFIVPCDITVRHIVLEVTAPGGGTANAWAAGLYSSAGVLLMTTGPQSDAVAEIKNIAITPPVSITAGAYYFAWTFRSNTGSYRANNTFHLQFMGPQFNVNKGRKGIAGTTSGSVLLSSFNPATDVVSDGLLTCPLVLFDAV